MNSFYRAFYLRTFVLFFLIIVPFLVLFTLGYDLNLNKSSLSKSLLINFDTLPRGANVLNNGIKVASTPAEISIQNGQQVTLNLEQTNYVSEKFTFFSANNDNSFAKISNLTLMPSKPQKLGNAVQGYNKIAILDEGRVLAKKGDDYHIMSYNFGGLQSESTVIQNPDKSSIKEGFFVSTDNGFWFPDDNTLLYQNSLYK
jgi:hypothetical protein